MKKFFLIVFLLVGIISEVKASNLPPVAVISSTPDRLWFYNGENIVFDHFDSYDLDQYINGTRWYINNVRIYSRDNHFTLSECFVLYGEAQNGCHELAQGVTTVSIKLGVKDYYGLWDYETVTYTIKEHQRRYFIKDHLGSVRTTVDQNGDVDGYDDYYPFGLVMPGRSSNSANPNDKYKFTGHERDQEAGINLDYMGARYYDPAIARFMQIDPLYAKYPSLSTYNYVANNPLKFIDPDGQEIINAAEKGSKNYKRIQRSLRILQKTNPEQYSRLHSSSTKFTINIGNIDQSNAKSGTTIRGVTQATLVATNGLRVGETMYDKDGNPSGASLLRRPNFDEQEAARDADEDPLSPISISLGDAAGFVSIENGTVSITLDGTVKDKNLTINLGHEFGHADFIDNNPVLSYIWSLIGEVNGHGANDPGGKAAEESEKKTKKNYKKAKKEIDD